MHIDPIDSAIDELAADVEKAHALLKNDDSQFYRRGYVRALFAYLEGFTYWIRQNAITIDKIILKKGESIDWDRHTLLGEEIPSIADNGKIQKRKQKASFKGRFAFSVRAYAEIVGCTEDIFGPGWERLLEAVKLRDRLTHPTQSADIIVSDENIRACIDGYHWFASLIVNKFKESAKAMMENSHSIGRGE
jgi:hypothetical protein